MIGFNRTNFANYRRRRCNPMYSLDKLSHIYSFLDLIAQNLSVDHLKSVHQNPLAYIKTEKEADRFKGMMEVYGLMADLSEKSSRVYKMAYKLDEVQEKLSYIEEAMGFLVKGLNKINVEGRFTGKMRMDRSILGRRRISWRAGSLYIIRISRRNM